LEELSFAGMEDDESSKRRKIKHVGKVNEGGKVKWEEKGGKADKTEKDGTRKKEKKENTKKAPFKFCPTCSNCLLVEECYSEEIYFRLFCQTCPYIERITTTIRETTFMKKKKKVDDVLGGPDAWKHADRTETLCPKCRHTEAYYKQLQMRSADEPMTTFYRCIKCGNNWRD